MSAGLISVNGRITPPEQAVIPALDRGFLFSDAVFETLVAFQGTILDTPRHMTRLRRSAESTQMSIPWSDAELEFELQALAEQVPVNKVSLRLVITRGIGTGLKLPPDLKPNKVIYCAPATGEPRSLYQEGIALKRLASGSTERGAAAKTSNYLRSIVGIQRAEQEGFQDLLWTNADGEITESSASNVFFMQREGDGISFVTPPASSGILLGITRETMIRLLREAKIPVTEQIIYADELPRFDEAFVCSTVRGLVPVKRIDQHRMSTARPSSVYRHIERLFLTWVESQLGFRVDWVTGERTS